MSWLEESASQQRQFCGTWAHSDYSGSHGRQNKRLPADFKCRPVGGGGGRLGSNDSVSYQNNSEVRNHRAQSCSNCKENKSDYDGSCLVIYNWGFLFRLVQINRTQHATAAPSSGRWHSSSCKNSLTHSFLSPVFCEMSNPVLELFEGSAEAKYSSPASLPPDIHQPLRALLTVFNFGALPCRPLLFNIITMQRKL